MMPRPRKLVKPTSQNEAAESTDSGSVFCTFQNTNTKLRPPIISFCDWVKSSFRNWLDRRKNRELFDSAKRIRYRWFLADLD